MRTMETSELVAFLESQDPSAWNRMVESVAPAIHPVDREATRIWFAFWPLELNEALRNPASAQEMARVMDLEGSWRLEEQIDRSVSFLYGARFWHVVKRAVLARVDDSGTSESRPGSLEELVRATAQRAAAETGQPESLLLGVSAVGWMALRQLGTDALRRVVDGPAEDVLAEASPDAIVRKRREKSRDGLFGFLKGVGRSYRVRWHETRTAAHFKARHGQDLAMAAAADKTNYRPLDYRRIEGPIPVECRIGSCGYCWVGVLSGRENLSPISEYERDRLRYFGYDAVNEPEDPHPIVRLACQAQCLGDVTLVIPPWNGELKRRLDHTARELGTI